MKSIAATLSLSILLSSLGTSIANVALPTLATAFSASFREVQWVVLAYLLAITTAVVGAGRLGDLTGRRRLLLGGIALFAAASALCGVAPTLGLLIAARTAQGLGAAVMMALAMALAGDMAPKEKTGSAMGLLGTMSAVGTALGPTLGGTLIAIFGWRSIFLVNVPLALLTLLLAWRSLPADRPSSRTASPLIRLELFRKPALRGGFITTALVTTVVMATLVVGPFYLSSTLGLDAARVGLVMAVGPVVAALTGVPSGRVVDRFGTQRTIAAGLTGMAAASLLIAFVPASLGVPGYIAPLVVLTAGYALFQTANNTAVMTAVAGDQRGVVSGMLNLSRNVGLIAGASVMGAVFTLGAGTADMTTAGPEIVSAGMHATFGFAAMLVGSALLVASGGWSVRVVNTVTASAE